MKTYHNEANTSGITKIALKNILDFLDKGDRVTKLQISDFKSQIFAILRVYLLCQKKSKIFLNEIFVIPIVLASL